MHNGQPTGATTNMETTMDNEQNTKPAADAGREASECGVLLGDDSKLCAWLRENSAGVYRPSALAAERIEYLKSLLNEAIEWNWIEHSEAVEDGEESLIQVLADEIERAISA